MLQRLDEKKTKKLPSICLLCHKNYKCLRKQKVVKSQLKKNLGQCGRGRGEGGTFKELTVSQYLKTPVLGRADTGIRPYWQRCSVTRRGPSANIPLE